MASANCDAKAELSARDATVVWVRSPLPVPDQSGEHLFSEVAAYSNRCRRPERLEDFGQGMQCCQLLHSWGTLSLVLRQEEDS